MEIRQGNAVDVIEIDAATNRGIDEIRELRDAARYAPSRDRYKIYILDEAHQITDAAFNALLKTLEEPPAHVIFMMATTQPEDIPQTIRSRCQHFSFHAVKFDDILALYDVGAQRPLRRRSRQSLPPQNCYDVGAQRPLRRRSRQSLPLRTATMLGLSAPSAGEATTRFRTGPGTQLHIALLGGHPASPLRTAKMHRHS